MHIVLTKDEYDNLVCKTSWLTLFKDSLENELKLKEEDIETYNAVGSKDIANQLKHEYAGMKCTREILLKIIKE